MAKKTADEDGSYRFEVGDVVRHRADQRVKAAGDKRWVFVVVQRFRSSYANADASKNGYRIACWSAKGSREEAEVREAELELVAKGGGEP